MRATIKNQTRKNQIKMAIIAVCVLFIGSSVAVAEETLLLASLTRATPLEDLDNYDRFPGYDREAREIANQKKIEVKTDVLEEIKKAEKIDVLRRSEAFCVSFIVN